MRGRSLALALLVAALPAGAQAPPAVGVNSAIRNEVAMQTFRDAALRPAVLREPVFLGTRVATGAASQLQLLLVDRSVFTVGAGARMVIDRFVYDPDRRTGEVAASVARGAFRFMSGRAVRGEGGAAAVSTPVASIGVRGTVLEGLVGGDVPAILALLDAPPEIPALDPEAATLVVLRGPGPRTQGLDRPGLLTVTAGGVTVPIDRPGFAILVPAPGAAPIGPFRFSRAAFARLSELLRTVPDSAGDEGRWPIPSAAVLASALEVQPPGREVTELLPPSADNPTRPATRPCPPGGTVCP
ncbi:MAG: FecR domain-containing protein [Thermaurantiacus tibetensis]|uniref:FecR family protein n=1 Tax=Thermaurantiacus tibetensis TaxID=2759035 RepID=UPI00188FB927|nr:FecR domain-containing protein [Thermaurantiacus tibetensis]